MFCSHVHLSTCASFCLSFLLTSAVSPTLVSQQGLTAELPAVKTRWQWDTMFLMEKKKIKAVFKLIPAWREAQTLGEVLTCWPHQDFSALQLFWKDVKLLQEEFDTKNFGAFLGRAMLLCWVFYSDECGMGLANACGRWWHWCFTCIVCFTKDVSVVRTEPNTRQDTAKMSTQWPEWAGNGVVTKGQHKESPGSWAAGGYCPFPAQHTAITRAPHCLHCSPGLSLTVLQISFGVALPSLALLGVSRKLGKNILFQDVKGVT